MRNEIYSIKGLSFGGKDYTKEPRLRLKRSSPQIGLEPRTARSIGQRLSYRLAGLLREEKGTNIDIFNTDIQKNQL